MMKLVALLAFVAVASGASIKSVAPFVDNAEDCGSTAGVLRMHVSGCTRAPCDFNAGTSVRTEIDFAPAGHHPHLINHITVYIGGVPIDLHKQQIPNSEVEAGKPYTSVNNIPIDNALKGVALTMRLAIYGPGDTPIIVCKRAAANIR